jgi:hypothetical protein
MGKKIKGFWRTFQHNIKYKNNYCKKVLVIILLLLIIDLICLWVVW